MENSNFHATTIFVRKAKLTQVIFYSITIEIFWQYIGRAVLAVENYEGWSNVNNSLAVILWFECLTLNLNLDWTKYRSLKIIIFLQKGFYPIVWVHRRIKQPPARLIICLKAEPLLISPHRHRPLCTVIKPRHLCSKTEWNSYFGPI